MNRFTDAALRCKHEIDGDRVVLYCDHTLEGNALFQLDKRLSDLDTIACAVVAEKDEELGRLRASLKVYRKDVSTLLKGYVPLDNAAISQNADTCVWEFKNNPLNGEEWYATGCKGTSTDLGKFCLHCGKRVEQKP